MDLVSWTFAVEPVDLDSPVRYGDYFTKPPCPFAELSQLLIDASNTSRSLSFRGLRSQVKQLVAGLQDLDIQPGDCICVNSFNDVRINFFQSQIRI